MEASSHPEAGGRLSRWAFWGFAVVAGYFLLTEHRAHMVNFLPYLLLAACPLMHFFHHGMHRHHHPAGQAGAASGTAGGSPDAGVSRHGADN